MRADTHAMAALISRPALLLWMAAVTGLAAIGQPGADDLGQDGSRYMHSEQLAQANGLDLDKSGQAKPEPSQLRALAEELASLRREADAARRELLAAKRDAQDARDAAAREREINVALQQGLLLIRGDLERFKSSNTRDAELRRELEAARQEVAELRRSKADAASARESAVQQERERAASLQRDLAAARRQLDVLDDEAATRKAVEAALFEAKRALAERDRKIAQLDSELLGARLTLQTFQTRLATNSVPSASPADEHSPGAAAGSAGEAKRAERQRDAAVEQLRRARGSVDEAERANATLTTELDAARRRSGIAEEKAAWAEAALGQERDKAEKASKTLGVERETSAALMDELHAAERQRDVAVEHLRRARGTLQSERQDATLATAFETAPRRSDIAEEKVARLEAALQQERDKAASLARDLQAVDRQRGSLLESISGVKSALEQERQRTQKLSRELDVARAAIQPRKAHPTVDAVRGPPLPKPRPAWPRLSRAKVDATNTRKPRSTAVTTIVLPNALLPTRHSAKGLRQ